MKALLASLVLVSAGGVTWYQATSEKSPVAPPVREAPKTPANSGGVVAQEPPAAPVGTPAKPAELLPIRAQLQPGLPGTVTLVVEDEDTAGNRIVTLNLTLTAAPIGANGYSGWAGYDAARNRSHIVFLYKPFPQMSESWLWGCVRGNGMPANPPHGCDSSVKLGQAAHPAPVPLAGFSGVAPHLSNVYYGKWISVR